MLSRHGTLLSVGCLRVVSQARFFLILFINDHQIYYSDRDPVALEECLCKEVEKANQWYNDNAMIVNETKHQPLILGDTEYTFSFPVKESIDIFDMNIDNKLQLDKHVSSVCKKINNQLNVMITDLENCSLKSLW